MARFVPWLLVALCFVLGVASRSIADSFPVFVPALERGKDSLAAGRLVRRGMHRERGEPLLPLEHHSVQRVRRNADDPTVRDLLADRA